ncbi:MAG: ABC transporter permease [Clostridia bacterium]|nr:ABC transporter permease [Clostridia bacterium]
MADFGKLSPFQVDPAIVEGLSLSPDDFSPASEGEKENMVEKRKSVSYWRDAARRFKANTVSMVALFIFLCCLVFAFIGPKLIPYSYGDQYRSSQKLGPMEYSKGEALIKAASANFDSFYATGLQAGSITAITKGNYFIEYKGNTYAFTAEKAMEGVIVGFLKGQADPVIVKEADVDPATGAIAAWAPLETTGDPAEGATQLKLVKGVFPHVFGTDSVGRDLMARTMYGARVSILIGLMAALIVLIIGSIYGAISGLAGGTVDFIMMRIVELIYSIPEVLIVLLLQVVLKDPLQEWMDHSDTWLAHAASALGSGIISIFITFALLYWVTMARIVRGQVLQLRKQEYVTAAVALGAGNGRIIKRHLLPNCVGALVITTCLQIPSAIFLESFLSFLGLGVSAPMASLGSLCSDALQTITLYPYRLIYPAVILTVIVLTLNLVGDGLRDALDPRLKK